MENRAQKFTNLTTWQEAHALVLRIYQHTQIFPRTEQYGLTSQMRRSAVSVTSNLAEGFGRQSYKEKLQYYYRARGSLTELENQLIIARDVRFLEAETFTKTSSDITVVHKLLNALIRKTREHITGQ